MRHSVLCGWNVVLPFIDRFPTDTELYCLLTTKPEEVSKP